MHVGTSSSFGTAVVVVARPHESSSSSDDDDDDDDAADDATATAAAAFAAAKPNHSNEATAAGGTARRRRSWPVRITTTLIALLIVVGAFTFIGEINPGKRSLLHGSIVIKNATATAKAVTGGVGATGDQRYNHQSNPLLPPPLCRRDQIIDGRWEPLHLDAPPYRPSENRHLPCFTREAFVSTTGWDTYQWVPSGAANDTCRFGPWDNASFCALTKYSTTLIVGDSLSYEHFSSLAHLLGQHPNRARNVSLSVCGGASRISYLRDDYLTNVRQALLDETGIWSFPQVVVFNKGAHYKPDEEFMRGLHATLDVVQEWLGTCDARKIKCHFYWRTTVPGHPNCKSFDGPINNKSLIESYIANHSLYDRTSNYHWHDFQHQNRLVEDELRKRRMPRTTLLDGYHINVLRPDQHSDCLHSCEPGKMDVYNQLLLHYLQCDRSMADADDLRAAARDEQRRWDVLLEERRHWNSAETTAVPVGNTSTGTEVPTRVNALRRRRAYAPSRSTN